MVSSKRRDQLRLAKNAERPRLLRKPKAYKAHKKAEAERKKKGHNKRKYVQVAQARRIKQLEAELEKNKKGYLHNMNLKDKKDERFRKSTYEHIKSLESKNGKWDKFWKELPRDLRRANIVASRGRYPANCPKHGFHKDPLYWDPNLSF